MTKIVFYTLGISICIDILGYDEWGCMERLKLLQVVCLSLCHNGMASLCGGVQKSCIIRIATFPNTLSGFAIS
ncbi:hypothetical protein Ahy_B10g104669 isoform B [Arachis hypogaea]|uniref:Uncharacterized protein n=1 Tax=Arachis hypogaea TaxID=3818 RepID=A0A444X672_ARAHY|nr:hypothetical protein Ahy_B10g104669 isoform B [Arachis hypogaea]